MRRPHLRRVAAVRRGASSIVSAALAAGMALAAPRTALAQGALPDSVRRRVDSVFTRWDHTDGPGCALGIGQNGKAVYEHGYGMSDLQHAIAITPSSIFHVASVSKEFTAFAIALLAEDGKLSLDDDIRKYIPELHDYGVPITLRQLVHHTSGYRDQWELLGFAGWREDDLITEDDVLDIVSKQRELNFRPGAEWVYSNTGYTLLAITVKRVSGKSLRDFAQERIFAPLGMTSTHFHDDHTMIVPGRTSAYEPRDGGGWKISIPVFDTYGATSLFTTAGDLLKWEANFDAPKVGSKRMIDELQTSGVLTDGTPTNYGFGLSVGRYRGQKVVGHGGADAGYRAEAERYPERGLAIAVLCNAANSGPGLLARRVADVVFGSSVPAVPAADTTTRAVAAAVRAQWEGTWRDTVTQNVIRLRLSGDTVAMRDGPRLVPTSDSTVRLEGSGQWFVMRGSGPRASIVARPRGTRDVTFMRTLPLAPDRPSLAAYAGSYTSDELDVRYEVALGDSGLVVRQRKLKEMRLEPAFADGFTGDFGRTFIFTRDKSRRIDGFTLTDGRARYVRFARLAR